MERNSKRDAIACAILTLVACVVDFKPLNAQDDRVTFRNKVEIIRDVAYAGTDDPAQRLDLFLPRDVAKTQRLPVVVFIHGGAWKQGDKKSGLAKLAPLVASGRFAGATIEYRLTDKAVWPAQIHDCKAAIRWLRGNAKRYNLDAKHIVVWGTSAGGHLVAMLGTSGGVARLEGSLGEHVDQSSRVNGVINFFGPSDLMSMNDGETTMDHMAADSPESLLVGGPILENKDKAREASPLTYVSSDDAPFLTMHGTQDPLVPFSQSQKLHTALSEASVPSILITVEGGGHGFAGAEIFSIVNRFLRQILLGEDIQLESKSIEAPKRMRQR